MSPRRWFEAGTLCVLLAGSAWLGQLMHHNYVVHDEGRSAPALAPADVPALDGAGVPAAVVLADRARPLLMLVLSTECPFCEANMPNWKALAAQMEREDAPELVVLSVSPAQATRAYLERHGLQVGFRVIDPSALELLGLEGYPSTVAFHPGDRRLRTWTGVLTEGDQRAVLAWGRTPWQQAPTNAN